LTQAVIGKKKLRRNECNKVPYAQSAVPKTLLAKVFAPFAEQN
jgi:hypothetical protein